MFMIYTSRKLQILCFYCVSQKQIEIDNRWMVPCSPVLSQTFQTLTNMESCSSVKSIKYIYKYINKGSDKTIFGLQNEHDVMIRLEMFAQVLQNQVFMACTQHVVTLVRTVTSQHKQNAPRMKVLRGRLCLSISTRQLLIQFVCCEQFLCQGY